MTVSVNTMFNGQITCKNIKNTVKPVYKDHSREPGSWPLYTG